MWSVINRQVLKQLPHIQWPIHYCLKSASKGLFIYFKTDNIADCTTDSTSVPYSFTVSVASVADITNFAFHLDINLTLIMIWFVYREAVNKYFYVDDMWDIVNLNNSLGFVKKLQRNFVSKYNCARLLYQQAMSPHSTHYVNIFI